MKAFFRMLCAAAIGAPIALAASAAGAQQSGNPSEWSGIAESAQDIKRRQDIQQWHENDFWLNGHRGYRHHRPGYRKHRGFWFPPSAFSVELYIDDRDWDRPRRYERRYDRRGNSRAHVEWCYDTYRSYRASDNTFQPFNGPRRPCYSPYS